MGGERGNSYFFKLIFIVDRSIVLVRVVGRNIFIKYNELLNFDSNKSSENVGYCWK